MNNRYLFSIILVVFIDLLGFSLIIPAAITRRRSMRGHHHRAVVASYAAAQLIGASYSDRLTALVVPSFDQYLAHSGFRSSALQIGYRFCHQNLQVSRVEPSAPASSPT
jgi:hypothetical protein